MRGHRCTPISGPSYAGTRYRYRQTHRLIRDQYSPLLHQLTEKFGNIGTGLISRLELGYLGVSLFATVSLVRAGEIGATSPITIRGSMKKIPWRQSGVKFFRRLKESPAKITHHHPSTKDITMSTSANTFSSEDFRADPIPRGLMAMMGRETCNKFFNIVLTKFEESKITKTELARRSGKTTPQITRWLSSPHNWTLETAGILYFAITGEEFVISGRKPFEQAKRNYDSFLEIPEAEYGPSLEISYEQVAAE